MLRIEKPFQKSDTVYLVNVHALLEQLGVPIQPEIGGETGPVRRMG